MDYDLIVLGGGPGGYLAAERAGGAGLRTLLVEERALGGVCLNEGCIPTKTLLHAGKRLDICRNSAPYGVTCQQAALDHLTVMRRKDKVVRKLVAGVGAALRKSGVEVAQARGVIQGADGAGIRVLAGDQVRTGTQLIIATGSHPVLPPIPGLREGLDAGFVLTSLEMLSLRALPESLVIVGGGVIGLEMAAYCAAAGVRVTVVELMDKLAGPMDGELSALLQKKLMEQGVAFHLSTRAAAIAPGSVTVETGGETAILSCDKVLLSIGRRASTEGVGLETLSIATDRKGIVIDDQCRTSAPSVYAVGDCTGRFMLAHTAYRHAEVAVNTILGMEDRMSYDAIPSVIYTDPEAASVGLTLQAAKDRGLDAVSVTLPMAYSGRYVAEYERGDGFCKLVFDREKQTMVGAHIAGGPASEIILTCGIFIDSGMPLSQMRRVVFPHPAICEIIREGLFQVAL